MHTGSVHPYSQSLALAKLQHVDGVACGVATAPELSLNVISADATLHQDMTQAVARRCNAQIVIRQLSLHDNMPHGCHARS